MNLENRHLDCSKNNSRESWKVESLPFNSLVGAFYRGLQREQAFEGVMVWNTDHARCCNQRRIRVRHLICTAMQATEI